ncbi:hypothetical protein MAR_035040 [Mya arenaria]|uniref:Uncharacterized protein n=1 Tax=Mya arenaria TaxID=6604 RepID=A0ABY7ENJ6_MYAAR|nr:hypothetical protein MAR_035040 [Mya arenaria]
MLVFGVAILNYLDDLAGVERPEMAQFAYNTLGTLLLKCGIEESHKKSFPPSDIMSFLGVLFNSKDLTIGITPERLIEIRELIKGLCQTKQGVRQFDPSAACGTKRINTSTRGSTCQTGCKSKKSVAQKST